MTKDLANPQKFLVTTPGLSATRWLSFCLASHPDVFVAHGKHPLDSVVKGSFYREKNIRDSESLTIGNQLKDFYRSKSLSEVFEAYRTFIPQAKTYGNVHSYTIHELMDVIKSEQELVGINILNVVRHPVTYIASHYALVRSAEKNPDLYQHYEGLFQEALTAYPELLLLECHDYQEFLAFAASCFSASNFKRDFSHAQFRHIQMEQLTTDINQLRIFCETLTGLEYSNDKLTEFIQQGPINQHRKEATKTNPHDIYGTWTTWQRDMVSIMMETETLDTLEEVGYDITMLRSEHPVDFEAVSHNLSPGVKCLGDILPPSIILGIESESLTPRLVEHDYQGFNIVLFQNKYYALAQSLGVVNLMELSDQELSLFQVQYHCFINNSLDELKQAINQFMTPELVETGYHSFNLVHYQGRYYALAQALGPINLTTIGEQQLKEYQASNQCFIHDTLDQTKQTLDQIVIQVLQKEMAVKDERFRALEQELTTIKSSRWFGVMSRIKRIMGRPL